MIDVAAVGPPSGPAVLAACGSGVQVVVTIAAATARTWTYRVIFN